MARGLRLLENSVLLPGDEIFEQELAVCSTGMEFRPRAAGSLLHGNGVQTSPEAQEGETQGEMGETSVSPICADCILTEL